MMQTEFTTRSIAQVGEVISHDLGAQMINDYQAANPTDTSSYQIGRKIIEQILAQPDCAGIKFFNAYNEKGEKTLVYVGLDQFGKSIVKYTTVSADGSMDSNKAIVADRAGTTASTQEEDQWFTELF